MNEVKIQIPDNCELIKNGNTYIVKKKKQEPPRSWEEFCKNYPLKQGEAYIDLNSGIDVANCKCSRNVSESKNWCTSKEEAEAFLALMQLRQLRKAWVGDWKPTKKEIAYGVISRKDGSIGTGFYDTIQRNILFPTEKWLKIFSVASKIYVKQQKCYCNDSRRSQNLFG